MWAHKHHLSSDFYPAGAYPTSIESIPGYEYIDSAKGSNHNDGTIAPVLDGDKPEVETQKETTLLEDAQDKASSVLSSVLSSAPSASATPASEENESTKSDSEANEDTEAAEEDEGSSRGGSNSASEHEGSSSSGSSELVDTKRARKAISSSVFTANYAHMALMLGYSLKKHNDLEALNAEMVLLVLEDDEGKNGITRENRTRLEKAGWKLRVAEELEFPGVNQTQIRKHHRHNLNKLHLFSWTEYDKIVFMDADTVCKGSIQDLLEMPGGMSQQPAR